MVLHDEGWADTWHTHVSVVVDVCLRVNGGQLERTSEVELLSGRMHLHPQPDRAVLSLEAYRCWAVCQWPRRVTRKWGA